MPGTAGDARRIYAERRRDMISVNLRDVRPIYEQIYDSFREQIVKGIFKPDEKLPSVREIAAELSINPNTIQRAFSKLEQEGYVYTVSGRGTFTAAVNLQSHPKRDELFAKFDHNVRELLSYGVNGEELGERIKKLSEGGTVK